MIKAWLIPNNGPFALFGGGYTTTYVATTEKYIYSNNIVVSGTLLGLARYGLGACGNSDKGIFGGGYYTTYTDYTDKYIYSTSIVAAGDVLGSTKLNICAAGNSTIGIFAGGTVNGTQTFKYTYSTDIRTNGTALALPAMWNRAAVASSNYSYFCGGDDGTDIYHYIDWYYISGDTAGSTNDLGVARRSLAACGNTTIGIICGGRNTNLDYVAYTDIYTFSNYDVSPGTALGLARAIQSAAGNSIIGIFGGGSTGSVTAYTDKYTFSNNNVTVGVVLGIAKSSAAATSSNPGNQ